MFVCTVWPMITHFSNKTLMSEDLYFILNEIFKMIIIVIFPVSYFSCFVEWPWSATFRLSIPKKWKLKPCNQACLSSPCSKMHITKSVSDLVLQKRTWHAIWWLPGSVHHRSTDYQLWERSAASRSVIFPSLLSKTGSELRVAFHNSCSTECWALGGSNIDSVETSSSWSAWLLGRRDLRKQHTRL